MRAKEFIVEFAPTGIYKPPTIPREPGRDPFGDDPRSQMVYKIQQLLDAGKSVFVSIPGARGRAVGTRIGDEYTWLNVRYRDFLKPKSRTRSILTVPLNTDNDADLILSPGPRDRFIQTTGQPFDYILTARPSLNIDNSDFFLEESFDQPYPITWEKSDADESVDALARLPDGSNLSIMFNQDYDDEGQGIYSVEFWRNNSQEVTGAGDSQRVFATVLAAIAQFIKKRKPEQLYFSANKDVEPGQKAGTRSNLYTSLVRRYASAMGYEADISDFAGSTTYKLYRLYEQSSVEENFADGKIKGKSRPGRVKRAGASCKGSVTDLRARAKKYGGERGRMYHWCANMKAGRKKNK